MSTQDHTTKICNRCGLEFPLTHEFFNKDKYKKSGFVNTCRNCRVKSEKYNRNKQTILLQGRECVLAFRVCPKCNAEYPLTRVFWPVSKEAKNGFATYCKSCNTKHVKDYTEKHHEVVKAKNRTRSKLVSASTKTERQRRWRKKHPQKSRARNRHSSARRRGAKGSHTIEEITQLFREQEGYCFHCGVDLIPIGYHEDHWIAITRGGDDYIENIRLLCPHCNRSKSNKLPHEWHPEKYPPPQE